MLQPPYFVEQGELAGLDFSRQIVKPGDVSFPLGAIGIYVDDDFWCVAALPYSYLDTPLCDVVREYWPTYADEATYAPDSGTVEQLVYFARAEAASLKEQNGFLQKALSVASADIARLTAGRTDMTPRNTTRLEAQNGYFIRQYEHLLVAMAHPSDPRADLPGVCAHCGLLNTNRVHQQEWKDRHDAGYPPDEMFHIHYGDER